VGLNDLVLVKTTKPFDPCEVLGKTNARQSIPLSFVVGDLREK